MTTDPHTPGAGEEITVRMAALIERMASKYARDIFSDDYHEAAALAADPAFPKPVDPAVQFVRAFVAQRRVNEGRDTLAPGWLSGFYDTTEAMIVGIAAYAAGHAAKEQG